METPFLIGKTIYLRPLRRADLDGAYLAWLNDPEVTRYLESGVFPQTREQLETFYDAVTRASDQVIVAVVDRETDKHIGNVKLGPIHWVHRKATFGILIGERAWWGRGVGQEATRLMVEYAFRQLNLRRIDLGVYADHAAAVRVYEKLGFKEEGRFREALFHEGAYKDHLWMGLLASEYIWPAPEDVL